MNPEPHVRMMEHVANAQGDATLASIFPGAAHWLQGRPLWCVFWLYAVTLGYMAFIIPGLILHVWCYKHAKRWEREREERQRREAHCATAAASSE